MLAYLNIGVRARVQRKRASHAQPRQLIDHLRSGATVLPVSLIMLDGYVHWVCRRKDTRSAPQTAGRWTGSGGTGTEQKTIEPGDPWTHTTGTVSATLVDTLAST